MPAPGRLGLYAFAALVLASPATSADPHLTNVQPRGGQRGTSVEVLFQGSNLQDAQEIVCHTAGFKVTALEVKVPTQAKATLAIAPDCRLGEHAFRVRTATGISELRTFFVGNLPTVDEKEPNSDFLAPQKISPNVTVHGVVNGEDVDYYAVDLKKGHRLSAEVEGMRLGGTFFDPYVAILDAKRFELASCDDHPLVNQDALCSVVAPADGTYYVQVRESSYGGSGACQYRLHVGHFPRPTNVSPSGGSPGSEVEVTFTGDAAGPITQKVKLPAVPFEDGSFGLYCQTPEGVSPSPLPFRLSDLPNVHEAEPNDGHADATKSAAFPAAFHGVISKPGDVDHFRFTAKKGQTFDVRCYARRHGSTLDPVMALGKVNQGAFVSNDDARGPDSFFRATIPDDGEYVLMVTDHLRKGSPSHTYRVEFAPAIAHTDVTVPQTVQYQQDRQQVAVAKGNRFAVLASATRRDWAGELALSALGLPPKVGVSTDALPPNATQIPVVFEAAPDAPNASALVDLVAAPADGKTKAPSEFSTKTEFVIANPGQFNYVGYRVRKLAVAVTDPVPYKLTLVQPKAPLVHNGSTLLKIVAERSAGFKGPITVVPLYNPPGVSAATSVVIPEGQNEVLLTVNASGVAPVRKWKYCVMGSANPGAVAVWASSQLIDLEISPPYVALKLERAVVEQGKPAQMVVKLTPAKPFEGKAKVKLLGLPAKVEAKEIEVTKDSTEAAFDLAIDKAAPVGTHKNLSCQLVVMENGEPVAHALGSAELRIDPPPPPKPNAPAVVAAQPMPQAPKTPNPPVVAPPKRLSRLEQLRLEQEEREKALREGKTPEAPAVPKK